MAVAAYCSVLSLSRVLDNMRHPAHLCLFPELTQIIDDLRQKLCFLQKFFEAVHSSKITEDELEHVVRKIPRVACEAEILIDNFVVDQLRRELEDRRLSETNKKIKKKDRQHAAEVRRRSIESFHGETTQVVKEIAQINEAMQTLTTTTQQDQEQPRKSDDHRPLTPGEKCKPVGFEDQVVQVLEKLACNQTKLVVLPIVGMGGIGKTTLARRVFDHPYNSDRFTVRIWLTISQDHSVKNILEEALLDEDDDVLKDTEDGGGQSKGQSEAELITQLHQKLFGQRYLIVLDDVWSLKAWDDLRRGFPDNGKGSRVIMTTRLSDIADSLGSHQNTTHSMKFLNEDKSWDLFSEKAFARGGRSFELEEIGRNISERCRGLPLMLVVIGSSLANSDMTIQHWRHVAENLNSVVNSEDDEHCSRILSLSYEDLPIHLKACFLHMRHIEEDMRILASDLIRTWVAQGLVKPMSGKSLEEAAGKYLEDLVGRNMILVRDRDGIGNIRYCGVHDLLRELSIKESDEEQSLELIPKNVVLDNEESGCVICGEGTPGVTTFSCNGKMSVCGSCRSDFPIERLSSVEAVQLGYRRIPLLTTYRCVELRFMSTAMVLTLSATIRLLWNLEVLNIQDSDLVFPKEIWEMPRLAHVCVDGFRLRGPPAGTQSDDDVVVLENLQTLNKVMDFMFKEQIVRRIPNLRKLHVRYNRQSRRDWPHLYLRNLARLQKLEQLDVSCGTASIADINKYNFFPSSLKKLSLYGCKIVGWDGNLTIIGSLPNLRLLLLQLDAVLGEEWNPIEGQFLKLKLLYLHSLDLVRWGADETHFPALEYLYLYDMKDLEAIPREFGGLNVLKSITVRRCRDSVVDSARDIVEEQLSNANEEVELVV